MICFLDTEFTDLPVPELLSIGLVTLDCQEHYVELDLACEDGQRRHAKSSEFVREVVLDFWGVVPGAGCKLEEMGRRTGDWLLKTASRSGQRIEVAFDYDADYALLEQVIRELDMWDAVCDLVSPVNVDCLTGTVDGELAAEEAFLALLRRGLGRHHALADARALRAAYVAAKGINLSNTRGSVA